MAELEGQKRQRRKDARPQEILEAAMETFAEQGFAGAKIEEIARRAGVAKGTVYVYFATKDALFEAMVRENISPIFERLETLVQASEASAGELLTAIVSRIYTELIDNPARRVIMQILIAEGSRFPHLTEFYHNEVLAKGKHILRTLVSRGIASGEFRPSFPLTNPEVIMAPAIMAAVWKMTFESIAPLNMEHFIASHLDLVLNGLRNRVS